MDNLKMVYPTSSIGGVFVQKIDGFQGGETPFVKLSDSCLHIVMETLPVNVRSERWPADIAKQGYIGRYAYFSNFPLKDLFINTAITFQVFSVSQDQNEIYLAFSTVDRHYGKYLDNGGRTERFLEVHHSGPWKIKNADHT